MSNKVKRRIIDEVLGSGSKHGTEHLYFCPSCNHHKKKLSVNFEKNVFKCWVCDYSGKSLRRIVKKHGKFYHIRDWSQISDDVERKDLDLDLFNEEQEVDEQRVKIPDEFKSLANKNKSIDSLPARGYLRDRGITKKDMVRWKIGYCADGPYSGRVVVPSFGMSGHCNYFVARSYDKNWRKYLNPNVGKDIIFNELYIDWDSDLVLVEGIFDAIVAGPNSVPILGSTLKEDSRLFRKIVEHDATVYLALDPDAEKKTNRICKKFLEYGIEVRKVPIAPYSDVGEMTKEEFSNRAKIAELMTQEDYLLKTVMSI